MSEFAKRTHNNLRKAAKGALAGTVIAASVAAPAAANAQKAPKPLFHSTGEAAKIEKNLVRGRRIPMNPNLAIVRLTTEGVPSGKPIVDPIVGKVGGKTEFFELVQRDKHKGGDLATVQAVQITGNFTELPVKWSNDLTDPNAVAAHSAVVETDGVNNQPLAEVPFTSTNGHVQDLVIAAGQPGSF